MIRVAVVKAGDKDMETPDVSTLKTEIAVLEGIIREKKEQLRISEAIEKQKDDLWRKHVAGGSVESKEDDEG